MIRVLAVTGTLLMISLMMCCGSDKTGESDPKQDALPDIPAGEIVDYEPVPLSKCQGSGYGSLTQQTLDNLAQYDEECTDYNAECVEVKSASAVGDKAFYCVLCGLYNDKMRCHMINPK